MGFLYSSLPLWAALAGWLMAGAALLAAAWKNPFKQLESDELQHLWLSTVVTLAVLWAFDIWVQDGAIMHLLGATLMVTLFGWALAMIGSCVVILLVAVILGTPWNGIGLTMVSLAIVPVLASLAIQTILALSFRRKRAVFVLGYGTLTSAIAVLAASAALLLGHAVLRDLAWDTVSATFLTGTAVLMVGECLFTTGMTALIAVYKPAWMKTFDQRLNRIDR